MTIVHWYHPTAPNACKVPASDSTAGIGRTLHDVTCAPCRRALSAFLRGCDETLKDAPAVKRGSKVSP